jgi:hypothetical protein
MPDSPPSPVAYGPGPRWFRRALVGVALLYFAALVKRLPDHRLVRPFAFFTRATCLFPDAATSKIEYRLAAWSCEARRWRPLDIRPYFPIRAEDKESRFHRVAHFYKRNRTVMQALDAYVTDRHAGVDDGISGPIGGIRLYQIVEPIPPVGSRVARWRFEPLAAMPAEHVRDLFYTPGPERKLRCEAAQ